MVKVSIIIPVYNAEKYLAECLDSILNQSLTDIEVVCVNDGSTDGSLAILEDFAKKDDRIKIISIENSGAGHARNVGLDNIQGEYFYFMDADDFIRLDTLEESYNASKDKSLEMLMFPLINYDDEKEEFFNSKYYDMKDLSEYVGDDVFAYDDVGDLIFKIAVSPVNKLYKTEFIKRFDVRFPEGTIFEDNIFFWNAFLNAKRVLFVKKYYYNRRIHHSSVMSSTNLRFIDTIKIHNMIFDIFKEHNIFDQFKSELFNKKVRVVSYRFTEVDESIQNTFFEEMQNDFELMVEEYGHEDIISHLTSKNQIIFNDAINSKTAQEFKLLMDHLKIATKNKKIKSKNKKLKKQIKDYKKENNTLLSSKSWKITKPLRSIKNFSFSQYFLNRSNSYLYYKNGYGKLSSKVSNLKRDVKKLRNKNNALTIDKNHLQLQSEIYQMESDQLNDRREYIYNCISKFDSLDETGLFFKLLQHKNTLDDLNIDVHEIYKNDMARIDIKNFGNHSNSIEILENSDPNSLENFPIWFANNKGKGLVIESYCSNLDLKLKAINDGKLKIILKSIDYRDKNYNRVNIFVEYTSLVVNGVDYLNHPDLYSHDHPFIAEIEVEDSEILDIHVEWVTYDRTKHYDGNADKEEIYRKIRADLLESDIESDILKKMPIELYGFYIQVLNYESYFEYLNFSNALKNNHDYVNKKKMQDEIDNFNGYGLNTKKRYESIIVSLTSFPERMDDIHFCLYSLLKQNFKPDKVILWLAREQFPNDEDDIPDEVLKLKENGLTIEWCKDIRSYKKLIPPLEKYPDSFIVTADDDVYYHEDWLEKMWNRYIEYPNTIISSRFRIVSQDTQKNLLPYSNWKLSDGPAKRSFLNFPTGAGGTMYFPGALSERVLDEEMFMRLCPTGDDIWFWSMAILNGTKITGVDDPYNTLTYVNIAREVGILDTFTLWNLNKSGNNDNMIESVLNEFPEIMEIIKAD